MRLNEAINSNFEMAVDPTWLPTAQAWTSFGSSYYKRRCFPIMKKTGSFVALAVLKNHLPQNFGQILKTVCLALISGSSVWPGFWRRWFDKTTSGQFSSLHLQKIYPTKSSLTAILWHSFSSSEKLFNHSTLFSILHQIQARAWQPSWIQHFQL